MKCKPLLLLMLIAFATITEADSSNYLLNNQLLKEAGFKTVWQSSVSLHATEHIDKIWEIKDDLYILTNKNYLSCISKDNGELKFSLELAEPGLPVFDPEFSGGVLTFVAGNKIKDIDPNIGIVLGVYNPGFTAVSRAVRNQDLLFMVSSEKIVHAVRYSDKLIKYKVSADDGSMITSIQPYSQNMIFASKGGAIASFPVRNKIKLWEFQAVAGFTAPIVIDKNAVYAGSDDTNVYKLNALTGQKIWMFRTGAPIQHSARPGEKVLYQFVDYKGLYAIDKETGKQIWLEQDGVDILTEKDGKAYIFTTNNLLMVMNNKTGKAELAVNFSPVQSYVVNAGDSKIYVADQQGRIACIEIVDHIL